MKTETLLQNLPVDSGPCFIVSESGEVKAVVLSYETFKRFDQKSKQTLPKDAKEEVEIPNATKMEAPQVNLQTISNNHQTKQMENQQSQLEHDEELDVSLNYEADPVDVLAGLLNP